MSRLLGLVIPDITNSFYAEIAKGVLPPRKHRITQ